MNLAKLVSHSADTKVLPYAQVGEYVGADFALTFGGVAENVKFDYAVYGDISKPAILIIGGISANCFPFDAISSDGQHSGWWQPLLESTADEPALTDSLQGHELDSIVEDFCIIGLSFWAAQAERQSIKISTFDQAELIKKLLIKLNIEKFHRVIGSSYGGMVALALAQRYPQLVDGAVVLCAADKAHAKSTACRVLQRRIVEQSLATNTVHQGLALARSLAMLSYRGEAEIEQRFANQINPEQGKCQLPIEGYFDCHGERFARQFDPYRFLNLSQSIDLHKVEAEKIHCPLTLIGFEGDQVVPPAQMVSMQKRLAAASSYVEIATTYGHDGFLKETSQLKPIIDAAIRQPELRNVN